ncbi:MAG: tRNA lysidine(34) synthetase [Clostridia bacterium]|jgi:tRNA 2-thiocytidine biosynthesis protein TtcA
MDAEKLLNKRILGQTRKAIHDYDMIQENDRIAVGVSGGKDSMGLLYALSLLQKFFPVKFELCAITIMSGLNDFDPAPLRTFIEGLGIPYIIEETYIGKLVFEIRQEKNPCSLCANMRRGALNNAALAHGCNKLALAHNWDDCIETFMMSMIYEGRLHTFSPVTHMERKNVYLIRPFLYCREGDILRYVKQNQIPVLKNPCPHAGKSKRQEIKEMLAQMAKVNPDIKSNIFGAIQRSDLWSR